jgi:hypothetical protein
MKRILAAAAMAATLMGAGGNPAFGEQQESHFKQAEQHANAALSQNQPGNTGPLVQHAQMALEHARMAQAEKPNPDMDKAIQGLEKAIEQGKAGDGNKAVEHTREALDYMSAAKAAMGG